MSEGQKDQKPLATPDVKVFEITIYQTLIEVRIGSMVYQKSIFGKISVDDAKRQWLDDFQSFKPKMPI